MTFIINPSLLQQVARSVCQIKAGAVKGMSDMPSCAA
jgi:hypothetical protein